MEMKDRIRSIMESQKMTQQEFADYIKIAPATLSSIFTGRTRPTLSIVEAIKNRFTNISTDWLMFGTGPMLKTDGFPKNEHNEGASSGDALESLGTGDIDEQANGVGWAVDIAAPKLSAAGAVADDLHNLDAQTDKSVDNVRLVNKIEVKKCDIRQRKISEIRIFYDDQTWETFVPKQ